MSAERDGATEDVPEGAADAAIDSSVDAAASAPAGASPVPTPEPSGPRCFLRADGEEQGPFSVEEIRRMVVRREIGPATFIRREDMSEFVPAEQLMDELVPPKSGPRPVRPKPELRKSRVTFMDRHPLLGLIIVFGLITTFFLLKTVFGVL